MLTPSKSYSAASAAPVSMVSWGLTGNTTVFAFFLKSSSALLDPRAHLGSEEEAKRHEDNGEAAELRSGGPKNSRLLDNHDTDISLISHMSDSLFLPDAD